MIALHGYIPGTKKKNNDGTSKSSKTGEKSNQVRRLKKDPNAPTRPVSAFVFFMNAEKSEMKQKHVKETWKEINERLKAIWNDGSASTDVLKKKYKIDYQNDTKRYNKEMSTYVAPPPVWEMVARKKKRDPDGKCLSKIIFQKDLSCFC